MIRQRHSYHRLFYHLVFTTKQRMEVFASHQDESDLFGALRKKANDLDAFIEDVGSWKDHVHLLIRCSANLALSRLYGQLKGFATRSWNLKHPDRLLAWGDGVFAATVDPDENEALRAYIRDQRQHHARKTHLAKWEPTDPGAQAAV